MYRSKIDPNISYKMTKRNLIVNFARRFYDIVKSKKCDSSVILSFVLVGRYRRSWYSSYWKIFVSENDCVIDVSREIGIILNYEMYNDYVIKETSYGVSVPDDICRKLETAFKFVFKNPVKFEYRTFNASLD